MKPVVRTDLRLRRLWIACGLLLAAAIAFVCLVPGEDLPSVGISDKVEHALAFAALAFWFGSVLLPSRLLLLVLGVLAFGGLIEIVQGLMGWGRDADVADFLADAAGTAAGVVLALTPVGRWARWLESRLFPAAT